MGRKMIPPGGYLSPCSSTNDRSLGLTSRRTASYSRAEVESDWLETLLRWRRSSHGSCTTTNTMMSDEEGERDLRSIENQPFDYQSLASSGDIENEIDERLALTRMREAKAKVVAWKTDTTMELMDKLIEEETAIDQWKKKKTAEAKWRTFELELKLAKQQLREMENMLRRIQGTQLKGAWRKLKAQATPAKNLTKVSQNHKKISVTRKPLWGFICH